MPEIAFSKYHGLGNDFVLIDALARPELGSLAWASLAPPLCDRHFGIGGDGLLVISPSSLADVRMSIFNADGSDGGMCGNGIRCVARHMLERRAWKRESLRVQVGAATLGVTITARDGRFIAATVDMGEPAHAEPDVSEILPDDLVSACERAAPSWRESCGLVAPTFVRVAMPNPHAVIFCRDVAKVPVEAVGPVIESHRTFPNRANVQFVQVVNRGLAKVRTWERGAGATLACGTGACAAVVAGVLVDRLDRDAIVSLPGGDLAIRWERETCHVLMSGPAAHVFDGKAVVG